MTDHQYPKGIIPLPFSIVTQSNGESKPNHKENIRLEEYKFLRTEHENNRKFVFERPLVIVIGMLAAIINIKASNNNTLILLPILFLIILWFNIWFTHNRVQSSSRIVAYIQLFHETQEYNVSWVGWENALLEYRKLICPKGNLKKLKILLKNEPESFDSSGFYSPIFFFHIFCGILFTPLILIQCGLLKKDFASIILQIETSPLIFLIIIVMSIFLIALLKYSPPKVKKAIVNERVTWEYVFKIRTWPYAAPSSNKPQGVMDRIVCLFKK